MTEFMRGVLCAIQPRGRKVLFDKFLHRRLGDSFTQSAEKQGIFIDDFLPAPDS